MDKIQRNFKKLLYGRVSTTNCLLQVAIGPRQIGKTTACQQIYKEWQGPKLFCTADNLATPDNSWIELNWAEARRKGKSTLLIFDEIQKISNWSEAVKKCFDEDRQKGNDIRVILLGSASLYLQKGLAESLAGRFELIFVRHWNFAETKKLFKWNLEKYLQFGGYPNPSHFVDEPERWQSYIQNSIIETVLFKDIFGLVSISKPALFKQVLEIVLSYPAQEISIEKIIGQLTEKGSNLTVRNYLQTLEKVFFIKILNKFSNKLVVSKTSAPKIICMCPALTHAFTYPEKPTTDPEWKGRILENAVATKLLEINNELYYWRERNLEVDLIVRHNKQILAIEVKSGRKKSSQGLKKFIELYPKATTIMLDVASSEKLLSSELSGNELFEFVKKI